MTTHRMGEMTTLEIADTVPSQPIVLLPAGAFEQHGPGLPMATDLIRAERVCAQVADLAGGRALIGPSIPVGVSPHHLAFAGTMSLSTTTFAAVVRDYLLSLHRHGFRRVLVVTGHGGNNAALTTVAQDLLVELPDLELAWTPLTTLARTEVAALDPSEVHGHSGEAETAQMLTLAPELVRTDLLEPGTTTLDQFDPVSRVARTHGQPTLTLPYDRLSKNGVLGDPRRVTPEDGEAIVQAIVQRITTFIQDWDTA
ncbi:creatininase family protein [Luteipulveratus mongoliensis]|uniref:Creatinine amidohydrolase n=1 Tax=Luteipulveratus mongoliensis TaxID=571913 RepID=A0A0K1JH70_9MICO|nr:creatininase family protein [Luteipulveratus mongoliensis]AKU16067.1 creatinine amidohydrolase [Luteipulveratus mongoliensis]